MNINITILKCTLPWFLVYSEALLPVSMFSGSLHVLAGVSLYG